MGGAGVCQCLMLGKLHTSAPKCTNGVGVGATAWGDWVSYRNSLLFVAAYIVSRPVVGPRPISIIVRLMIRIIIRSIRG